MNARMLALDTGLGRLPPELINHILRFALGRKPRCGLISKLRLVCKPWADHFYLHGLFDTVSLRSTLDANRLIDRWSSRALLCPRDSSLPVPLPSIRKLELEEIWDPDSFPGAKEAFWDDEKLYLAISTVTRLLQLFSDHLEELDLNFVDCLIFSQASIEAAKNCTRLADLSLSLAAGRDKIKKDRPSYDYFQPPTLFEFLAAAPTLKNLNLDMWEIMSSCTWSNLRPPCHIENLTINGRVEYAGAGDLARVSSHLNSPVKVLRIHVRDEYLDDIVGVPDSYAKTLEALSIKSHGNDNDSNTADDEDEFHDLFAGKFCKLKVLFLPWKIFRSFEPNISSLGCVETMAVDGYVDEEFETVWESARQVLPNLKRLFFSGLYRTHSSIDEIIGDDGPDWKFLPFESCNLTKLINIQNARSNLNSA